MWHDDIYLMQAQKAILDTELDIINKESEGADTSVLRKKVADLKRQVDTSSLCLIYLNDR